jgi:hypothetical protein
MPTPVPPSTIFETRNYVDAARPFKNADYIRSASRRGRTLKQILAAEREAGMGGESSATGKRKGKKMPGSGSGYGTATASRVASTQASRVGSEEAPDGDTTSATFGEAMDAVEQAAAAAAKRKRDLPTCESSERWQRRGREKLIIS